VARVDADADPAGMPDQSQDGSQMLKAMSNAGSLAGRVLEKHRPRRPDPFERLIEPVCDPCKSLVLACPHVRSRVEYEERDTEKARPFHFINESAERFPAQNRIGGGQIDEIAAMSQYGPNPAAGFRLLV
jgi:hypothetical protein